MVNIHPRQERISLRERYANAEQEQIDVKDPQRWKVKLTESE